MLRRVQRHTGYFDPGDGISKPITELYCHPTYGVFRYTDADGETWVLQQIL
jgi:hypothetical protein